MARLLIKAADASHPDPIKDKADMYKRGDVVAIEETGHIWSPAEELPIFYRLDLPNMSAAQVSYLLSGAVEPLSAASNPALRAFTRLFVRVSPSLFRARTRQRRYSIDIETTTVIDKEAQNAV